MCVLPKPPSDELALRALRLQEAVNNGDLSPQEAQKILQGKPFPPRPPHGPGSSAPGARNAAAQHHDRFWRDERRRIAPAEQN
ncbi:hypothetical protein THUN1379_22910 [Paludibacterium sp. THUN1379]|nr:hypothetical protein THUN1379_22910 [Paludibacterium sp. THUN1379]